MNPAYYLLAKTIVALFGSLLIVAAILVFVRPRMMERFLNAFASSARAHYLEQTLRLIFGVALLVASAQMFQPDWFRYIGWLVIVTTIGLLLIPWRWHQRFAQWVMPPVIRYMRLYALGLAGFGVLLLYAIFYSD